MTLDVYHGRKTTTQQQQCTLHRILETVVTFRFSGGKVYSLNKGCHSCMIKHTMHVQSVHCSILLHVCVYTWLEAIFTS